MKHLSLLCLLLVLISCDSEDDTVNENGDVLTYHYFENARVHLDSNNFTSIENGVNRVFEYEFVADDNPNLADDEFAERILFEVPLNMDNFSFSNQELNTIHAYYDKYCFCLIEGSIPLSTGTIRGTRINSSTFEIEINVEFEDFGTISKVITANFVRSNLR